jgi:hypothetical protein
MSDLIGFLDRHGCFGIKHSGETLGDHLMNTYRILRSLGAPETICLAGGLHSIYGTNAFQRQTIDDRDKVKQEFGPTTERLAYIFGRISRPKSLEEIAGTGGILHDRLTGEPFKVSAADVWALRLIEAANLLEQDGNLSAYPEISGTMEQCLSEVG